jgi:hypothetical protein
MQQMWALRAYARYRTPEEIPPQTNARFKGHPTSHHTPGHED